MNNFASQSSTVPIGRLQANLASFRVFSIAAVCLTNSLLGWTATPVVRHEPQQPKAGQTVRITADFKNLSRLEEVVLEYQVVDPGKYISLSDASFKTQWLPTKMNDEGAAGDKMPGDGIYSVELPSTLQKHRRLVRYRISSPLKKKVLAPDPEDAQPNFAYFVYDAVPAWSGAVNPKSTDPKLREPVTYSADVLQRLPVYHFISHRSSVEKATWYEPNNFGSSSRNNYKYTGTMVYDGIVYDHVQFRARGGTWRHAMGKNMWKFNFQPGHRFRAKDAYGNPYQAKWDKLNLGACIQQGNYGMRGEQGMFEAVGFRLFNLAGLEAPRTHWVHLRIITQSEESPPDQYSGDFWGLYLATENIDGQFLKEHKLPPGNVYKIEGFQGKPEFKGDPTVTNRADVTEFVRATMRGQQPPAWWEKNLDLARYYNYRSILECIHHYDIDSGKNYFYYLNPRTHKWIVLPWDLDLSWGDNMFGGGYEPFFRAGLVSRPPFKEQYQERLAEIRDLLFNKEQLGLLIDEHAAVISDPKGGPSIADADRAKWDFHPMLASRYVDSSKAGHGGFYFGIPHNKFPTMVQYMKSYAAKRMTWIDSRLLGDYRPPPAPKIAAAEESKPGSLKFKIEPSSDSTANVRWRLAEITDPKNPRFDHRQPSKYEINASWEKELKAGQVAEIPSNSVAGGRVYRVRARMQDAAGRWSRWSSPIQFTAAPTESR